MALITGSAVAQLPKECFFVTKMHGLDQGEMGVDIMLTSDLPWLMKNYQPGMEIEKIEGFSLTDDDYQNDHLTGLRMHMRGGSYAASKTMSLIGTNLEPEYRA